MAGPERLPLRMIEPLEDGTLTTSVEIAPRTPAPVQVPVPPPRLLRLAPFRRVKAVPARRLP